MPRRPRRLNPLREPAVARRAQGLGHRHLGRSAKVDVATSRPRGLGSGWRQRWRSEWRPPHGGAGVTRARRGLRPLAGAATLLVFLFSAAALCSAGPEDAGRRALPAGRSCSSWWTMARRTPSWPGARRSRSSRTRRSRRRRCPDWRTSTRAASSTATSSRRADFAAGRRGVTGAPGVGSRVPAGLYETGVGGTASCAPVRRRKGRHGLERRAPAAGRRSLNWERRWRLAIARAAARELDGPHALELAWRSTATCDAQGRQSKGERERLAREREKRANRRR
ncbi:hypothetical protein C2845_PM11G03060 [Panicum miliaceum]|uniref:Uncharacterized protein n=1 Tax=Panicum miliaceum TaxID=4540 RepID=A0A3L6RN57_PANMI|nr:hypothetical protein C2845_PM11G03060 [Panicum miliaceum]